jgi:hypothetical protein
VKSLKFELPGAGSPSPGIVPTGAIRPPTESTQKPFDW